MYIDIADDSKIARENADFLIFFNPRSTNYEGYVMADYNPNISHSRFIRNDNLIPFARFAVEFITSLLFG